MYVLEEIAKKKFCPFVRDNVASGDDIRTITIVRVQNSFCCCASDCMMWRTTRGKPEIGGYCGLAGEPQ